MKREEKEEKAPQSNFVSTAYLFQKHFCFQIIAHESHTFCVFSFEYNKNENEFVHQWSFWLVTCWFLTFFVVGCGSLFQLKLSSGGRFWLLRFRPHPFLSLFSNPEKPRWNGLFTFTSAKVSVLDHSQRSLYILLNDQPTVWKHRTNRTLLIFSSRFLAQLTWWTLYKNSHLSACICLWVWIWFGACFQNTNNLHD